MVQKEWRIIVVFLWLLLVASACTLQKVKTVEIGEQVSMKHKMLIATEYGEFKTTVVDGIIAALKNEPLYVKVIDVTQLKEENAADFDAILIINTCMAWNLSPEVLAFIDKVKSKDRLIVLATAGDEQWTADLEAVDVMTSASQMESADQVTITVTNKLRTLLATQ